MKSNQVTWNGIQWKKIQLSVSRVQNRIYRAQKAGDLGRVHFLQKMLINSLGAKLLATRQVTTLNKGRSTKGVDKQLFVTPEQKLKLAVSLQLDGEALPIRRVWIPKPGRKEMRPLGIPTVRDRAKQALAKLALEPQWEAMFEPNSYGFRPGRSAHDAIEAIFLNLRHNEPKWVYDADIRKCFDRIDHAALLNKLNTFPLMRKQVKAWLESGVMEGYANTPRYEAQLSISTMGTPQGGIISPLLANIALHGLENHLLTFVSKIPGLPHPGANRGNTARTKALGIVRYADDFVLIHRNKEIVEKCIGETKKWLGTVGLEISEEKSAIRDCRGGFKFLGFQIIQVRKLEAKKYKVRIQPSKSSQERFLLKIRDIIQRNKASSAYNLIKQLRPIVLGWANYFKYCECKSVFSKLTHQIFLKLRAWTFRRDVRNGRRYIKQVYFPSGQTYSFDGSEHKDNWILFGKNPRNKEDQIYLPHIVWVKSRKHVKVKGEESPYSQSHYWALRSYRHSPYSLRVTTLLLKQKQKCGICNVRFNTFDASSWEVDHITPRNEGGKDEYKNLQLVHKECHLKKTASEAKRWGK